MRCGDCGKDKSDDEFHRRGRGRQSVCKPCRSVRDKRVYDRDPAAVYAQKKRHRAEMLAWARSLKEGPCADCGKTFAPVSMQWDHPLGSIKTDSVSEMVNRSFSKVRILAEIAKCELVCSNCHAVRTEERRIAARLTPTS